MPGRVDEQGAAGQLEQLAMGRRVAAARVRSSRTAAVAWRSSPSSALTSVDLPTPDEPRMAAVVPGRRYGAARRAWSPVQRRDRDDRDAGRDRIDRDEAAIHVVGEVGLVEDDDRGDRRLTRRPRGSARCGGG